MRTYPHRFFQFSHEEGLLKLSTVEQESRSTTEPCRNSPAGEDHGSRDVPAETVGTVSGFGG